MHLGTVHYLYQRGCWGEEGGGADKKRGRGIIYFSGFDGGCVFFLANGKGDKQILSFVTFTLFCRLSFPSIIKGLFCYIKSGYFSWNEILVDLESGHV